MRYGGGNRYYTLKALLYEADGTFVQEVCSRGWLEGDFSEGAIYNADGKQRWAIMANPNALGLPAYTMSEREEVIYWGPNNARPGTISRAGCASAAASYAVGSRGSYPTVITVRRERCLRRSRGRGPEGLPGGLPEAHPDRD